MCTGRFEVGSVPHPVMGTARGYCSSLENTLETKYSFFGISCYNKNPGTENVSKCSTQILGLLSASQSWMNSICRGFSRRGD